MKIRMLQASDLMKMIDPAVRYGMDFVDKECEKYGFLSPLAKAMIHQYGEDCQLVLSLVLVVFLMCLLLVFIKWRG